MTRMSTKAIPWQLAAAAVGLMALWTAAARAYDYEVEVIVFRHAVPQENEAWSASSVLPDFAAARRLAEPESTAEPLPEPASFTRLPATALRLAGAAKLLAGSAQYEVISHQAWRQPGDAGVAVYVEDAQALATPAAAQDPTSGSVAAPPRPRAEGSLRLQVALPDMRVQSDFVVLAGDVPVRVQATRNLRSGELHYLDHELLGVLLQVTSLAPALVPPESTSPNEGLPVEEFSD